MRRKWRGKVLTIEPLGMTALVRGFSSDSNVLTAIAELNPGTPDHRRAGHGWLWLRPEETVK
jgi:hypothetical protein